MKVTAKKIAMDEKYEPKIEPENLGDILGPPKFIHDIYADNLQAGVVTGLAWTPAGGEILFVESTISKPSALISKK